MKVARIFLCFVAITVKAGSTEDAHPMLYFSKRDVKRLMVQASYSHASISAEIEEAAHVIRIDRNVYLPPMDQAKFSSTWNEHFGNNLCMLAMYGVLYPDDDELFEITMTYMDRMASYSDWYVTSSPKDNVPIGHSLTGFATAYDFLYSRLNEKRKIEYYHKIKNTTADLYRLLLKGRVEWSRQYIHNHAPSNLVALLLGALIVSNHEPKQAEDWLKKVKLHLDFALELFSYIIDGSVDEGVSYGSYTSRGMTQYVYLAKRHFNCDHSENPWLKEHFWFYFYTILPGYQRTVGIGDTNYHWFYGPESQIVFLDAFILRNGNGNWLADKIRSSRSRMKPLAQSKAQIWSTFHTEFLFFNSSHSPSKPSVSEKLHIFSDWGVVTWGGGQESAIGNTFFSFKSGVPNGEAVQDIMNSKRYPDMVRGWNNFNAGHEHPDQNSFVFAPNGRYVVTESLYGPKMTQFDNTIMFSPSSTSNCNQPWEGQIGECDKWLKYKLYNNHVRGKIITATSSRGMVFVAGEAVGAYSNSMKLASVYRGTLLLNSEVLVVVDSIRLRENSPTKYASILFHNTWKKFQSYNHLGYQGASINYPEGSYKLISIPPDPSRTNISFHENVQPSGMREGPTNYVNVTFSLRKRVTNVVHVFSGPNNAIKSISLEPISEIAGVSVNLIINNATYQVQVSTFYKTESRIYEPTRERKRITGFGGFAQVQKISTSGREVHYFGLDNTTYNNGMGPPKRNYFVREFVMPSEIKNFPSLSSFTSSFDQNTTKIEFIEDVKNENQTFTSLPTERRPQFKSYIIVQSLFSLFLVIVAMICIAFLAKRWKRAATLFCLPAIFLAILGFSMLLVNILCIDKDGRNKCCCAVHSSLHQNYHISQSKDESGSNIDWKKESAASTRISIPSNPFVFLTSLPGSGGDILGEAFKDSNLSVYLPTATQTIPGGGKKGTNRVDLCVWGRDKQETHAMGWFNSVKTKPVLHFNQKGSIGDLKFIQQQLRENRNAPIAMNDNYGFWITKLPWVRNAIGREDFQSVLIVRDPRSWIHALLTSNDLKDGKRLTVNVEHFVEEMKNLKQKCSENRSKIPFYFDYFENMYKNGKSSPDDVDYLAMTWIMATGSALINTAIDVDGSWPLHVVRFEDLINDPETTTTGVFSKLGLPLDIPSLNKVMRNVKSGHYSIPHDGILEKRLLTKWKKDLNTSDIEKIESICGPLMKLLNYDLNKIAHS